MEDAWALWDSEAPAIDAQVEEIEHSDARGMQRVYGRDDHFGSHCAFKMDIWRTREGRVLMRCWSRCQDIAWRSFEIKGLDLAAIRQGGSRAPFSEESWILQSVRLPIPRNRNARKS